MKLKLRVMLLLTSLMLFASSGCAEREERPAWNLSKTYEVMPFSGDLVCTKVDALIEILGAPDFTPSSTMTPFEYCMVLPSTARPPTVIIAERYLYESSRYVFIIAKILIPLGTDGTELEIRYGYIRAIPKSRMFEARTRDTQLAPSPSEYK